VTKPKQPLDASKPADRLTLMRKVIARRVPAGVVDDIVQNAAVDYQVRVKVYEEEGRDYHPKHLSIHIAKCAACHWLNAERRRREKEGGPLSLEFCPEPIAPPEERGGFVYPEGIEESRLCAVLKGLPLKDRRILRALMVDDLTLMEVSRLFGWGHASSASYHRDRILAAIRELLGLPPELDPEIRNRF